MELSDMRQQVLSEMVHIPNWPKPGQSYLRSQYWLVRMNSLGKKAEMPRSTASEVLKHCITFLRDEHPEMEFTYDKDFFEPSRKRTD
jgi:hypothetical protein